MGLEPPWARGLRSGERQLLICWSGQMGLEPPWARGWAREPYAAGYSLTRPGWRSTVR